VPILIERLRRVPGLGDWEIIFVDDNSPDGTIEAARAIGECDSRVRSIRRIGRRGLAGACLEGMLASHARYLAVIDGDLQHDEALLASMLDCLRTGCIDLVVASRYVSDGSASGLSKGRASVSRWSKELAQRLLRIDLTDPLSGFFMIRRDAFEPLAAAISSQGFKILLDILATARGRLRAVELPATFHPRRHGESKLDSKVALDFGTLVISKLTHNAVPPRFLLFCLVGITGIVLHLGMLLALSIAAVTSFAAAQTLATVAAITWNFMLNNWFTYRDQRLNGGRFLTGLLRFQVICVVGAVSNVGIAAWIHDYDDKWWIAGLGGALVGTVWNFAVSAAVVWRQG
jgi:dolichol-phosphate mannosyltransferase